MADRHDHGKSAILRTLTRKAQSARRGADFVAFVRQFYARLAAEDLRRQPVAALLTIAAELWDFAARRRPGRAQLRARTVQRHYGRKTVWRTAIEIVNDDMPFLVDSVTAELQRRNLIVHLVIHPILFVRRDRAGRRLALHPHKDAGKHSIHAESVMHIETDAIPESELPGLERALMAVLDDVRCVVADWQPMKGALDETIEELDASPPPVPAAELAEVKDFLEWLRNDHFSFHGFRTYDLVRRGGKQYLHPVRGTGLGLLRKIAKDSAVRHKTPLTPHRVNLTHRKEPLIFAKAMSRATVHRAVPLDFIGVRRFDGKGRVIGEHRILGLYSSIAYGQSPRYIPKVREKVRNVIARAGYAPQSHDGKALLHILETYPRDELFQCPEDKLFDIALGILQLQERQRVALFTRSDPFESYVSCLIFVPRDRYTTQIRLCFEEILERAFNGTVSARHLQVTDEALARVHLVVTAREGIPDYDTHALEAELAAAARSWGDRLHAALSAKLEESQAAALASRYIDAFPAGYQERYSAEEAIFDIGKIEKVLADGRVAMHLYRPAGAAPDDVRLKIFQARQPIPLSDILPLLEHMGFLAVTELPFPISPKDAGADIWIQEFGLRPTLVADQDIGAVRDGFEECLDRVFDGSVEDDAFNGLVVAAGLSWREIIVLRCLCKFLRQTGIPFSESYMQETLLKNHGIARFLVTLFLVRFDPRRQKESHEHAMKLRQAIETALEKVASLDEDRILRRFYNLVQVALRTNHFQPDAAGNPKPYLSIKFDSPKIDELPAPKPLYEIFVYSPAMEGVHLRGGKVARGGIRWSDRREDFRTEILGLMKAQMVKNAIIIPVGAKGGFVLKRPPPASAGREALHAEVVACYRTLIRGMLDLTDNLKGKKVVPPQRVVRYDEDDPYLVVAADKGTASFSDIANALSVGYGFWLGDAFASGGSAGYDHKRMGITARGAWESVKRHFRELGRDVAREDFTVGGVGGMSGDVFGNGMLLSKHIRLVAVFDHQHIFIDPDPDARKSFAERKRLFRLPRASWADYHARLISRGGGVFDRRAKSIKVTPQMKARFDIAEDVIAPNALIRAILCAKTDLLWFGGIGTFVRAVHETDAEIGDRANDSIRVKAQDLRCRVVGEGANLGVTQAGRVEFALHGGRINTDAIDNSGGVDCSDHEVNIKIALAGAAARGKAALARRNRLLRSITKDVAALVLRDNYLQTQAISVDEARGGAIFDQNARLIRSLERAGRLDRALEYLPDEDEIAERQAMGRGLTRPEIAVLLAYAKIATFHELIESDLPDDALLEQDLIRYFPAPLQRRQRAAIKRHPLRREIIATMVANSMVNRVGCAFVSEMEDRTGLGTAEIARAYAATRDVFALRDLWCEIEALDNRVDAATQIQMMTAIIGLVDRGTSWFLARGQHPLDITAISREFAPAVAALKAHLPEIVSETEAAMIAEQTAALMVHKVPEPTARAIASLEPQASTLDIVRLAHKSGRNLAVVGQLYFTVGMRFGIDRLRREAETFVPETPWQRQAVAAVVADLFSHQAALTAAVLQACAESREPDMAPDAMVEAWISLYAHAVERTDRLLAEIKAAPALELPMLGVASRQIRTLVGA